MMAITRLNCKMINCCEMFGEEVKKFGLTNEWCIQIKAHTKNKLRVIQHAGLSLSESKV